MDVFITGSSGFVGKNLTSYLAGSVTLRCCNRDELNKISKDSFVNEDVIIHLAGKAHDLKKASNANEYYKVNFELTKRLYDAFLESNAKKFIFISSVKASADTVVGVLTEDVVPDPKTDYGKSKLMAEQYIQSRPLPSDKSYYILRPCMVHGPGNKGNLNLLYQFVRKNIPYPLAGFINKRSFLSVDNLCFVIQQLLMGDDIASDVYNVADDEALSTSQVVSVLASSLNVKPSLWKISPYFIRRLAKIGDFLHLPLTTERLNKLTENYIVDNMKIKSALKKELPISTRRGLEITANSFINNYLTK
ncbi:NAD-dependent epimerase/dehydratase family protein [Mucilaginibacter sp.]|jgi:nucleoside-diphosphate-sugar epimerase|uniref:NAD-dependent epimerase/dehydratase family protein n=1 Tax=Mucilaginibacter sp. TaxID=1882438 RepID=UPI0035641EF9